MSNTLKFLLVYCLIFISCSTNIEDEYSPTGEFICPLTKDLPDFPPSAIGTEENLFQGDILIKEGTPEKSFNKQAGVISALWEDRVIPIYFDSRWYDNPEKFEVIKKAFQIYEDSLDFTFVVIEDETEFFQNTENGINVKYSGIAASYIGKQGGIQDMYLPHSRNSLYSTSIHEIGHAVGLHHPHVTERQDEWLTIYWDNIREENKNFFMTYEKYDENYGDGNYRGQTEGFEYADEYDIYSVMNYGSNSFAIDPHQPTMTLKDGTRFEPSETLSKWDVISIDRMYKCYYKNFQGLK